MKSTAEHLQDALHTIAAAGECDVSRGMKYSGVIVETAEGPKIATLTLKLDKLPKS